MDHHKQKEIELLLQHGVPLMLVGPAGSGKTTAIQKAAKSAGKKYSFISGTRQTTVSNVLGFMSVNGTYVKSTFRVAYEEGHYFNIDEIDGMDPNCLLVFNSLENSIMSFPDGYAEPPHENFRLVATSNPFGDSRYTGRAILDASTVDRFDKISMPTDSALEASLVSKNTYKEIETIRNVLSDNNVGTEVSMRDALRLEKRKELNLVEGYIEETFFKDFPHLYTEYAEKLPTPKRPQEDYTDLKDLWDSLLDEETQ